MLQFPPTPSWDAMHPLLIHFPIVLLLLTPLLVAISAALSPPRSRPYLLMALIILLLGTGSLFLAASSGEEAAELADRADGVNAVLSAHEALASTTKSIFSVCSLGLLGLFAWPRLSRRPPTRVSTTAAPFVFLAVYSVGILYLVNTAHAGGRLVHEFGVHAMLPAQSADSGSAPVSTPSERDKRD